MYNLRKRVGDRECLDDTSNTACSEWAATLVDQQCGNVFLAGEQSLTYWQVGSDCPSDGIAERNVALFFPFAANQDGLGAKSYVVEFDAGELRITDAAAI